MTVKKTASDRSVGFTIVELLVVIVIIGILATITVASYTGITKKATEAMLQADLSNASKQLKIYQATNDAYPSAIDCSLTPTINTVCLKPSSGSIYAYSANNSIYPSTFKLYESSASGTIYKITDNTSPVLSEEPGTLKALTTPTIIAGTNPYGIVVSPDGNSVYSTNRGSNTVSMYTRNTSTGVLTAMAASTIATDTNPQAIAISPDGTSVYVANYYSRTVSMYTRNTSTGVLTAMTTPTIATGGGPQTIAISPDGTSVYVNNFSSSTVSMYSRNTSGVLIALEPSSIDVGSYAYQNNIVISPDGTLLYVVTNNPGSILMYIRNFDTGILTATTTPILNNTSSKKCIISPDGTSFYAVGENGGIRWWARDTNTGALTNYSGVAADNLNGYNNDIITSPDGISAYATSGSNIVLMYARNASTGVLTVLSTPTIATDTNPHGIAISADGNSVYVANYGSGTVSMFTRY